LKYSKYITLSSYATSYNTSYNTLFHYKAEKQTSFEMMKTHRSNSRGTLNFRFQYMLSRIVFRRQCQAITSLTQKKHGRIVSIKVLLIS